jgi:hypothetical protein
MCGFRPPFRFHIGQQIAIGVRVLNLWGATWPARSAKRTSPARGPSGASKWNIIAVAVLTSIQIAAAARQFGVSRSWASREASAAGTRPRQSFLTLV